MRYLLFFVAIVFCNGINLRSTNNRQTRTSPFVGASMRDFDGWSRNAWGADCYFQPRVTLNNLPPPPVVNVRIKVDPTAQTWYYDGGAGLGIQWITANSAYTVELVNNVPTCWKIPGWNFTQQVNGYRLMYEYSDEGAKSKFTGFAHDCVSCGCSTSNTMEFQIVGNEYRLLTFAQMQRYPLPPQLGAKGVALLFTCPPNLSTGAGPTAEEMTLPDICGEALVRPDYCSDKGYSVTDCDVYP